MYNILLPFLIRRWLSLFYRKFPGTNWILPPLSSLTLGFFLEHRIDSISYDEYAEERRLGTLETLMSAPVNAGSIVLANGGSYIFLIIAEGLMHSINPIIVVPRSSQSLGFNKSEHWISGIVFLMSFGASFQL